MSKLKSYLSSSVGRKQVIAITGLGLVLFLVAHLLGNLLIFKGPEAFNQYAETLKSLGNLLNVARAGLILMFVLHIYYTVKLVMENRAARQDRYAVSASDRSFATKTMRYTGPLVFFFLVFHLLDFTLQSPLTQSGIVNGVDLGLYGKVYQSLTSPLNAIIYIAAMLSIGFHLSHGIQSTFQTFGINGPEITAKVKKVSITLGVILALGFSSIPIYLNYIAIFCSQSACCIAQ